MRKRVPITLAAIVVGVAGFLAIPGTAFAQTPCTGTGGANSGTSLNNGGDCTVSGTIAIASSLAIATDMTSFTLAQANNSGTNPAGGGHNIYVLSNDSKGYYVSTQSTDYTGTGGSIPNTDVSAWSWQGPGSGSYQPYQTSAVAFAASSAVSGSVNDSATGVPTGWDGYGFDGFYLNTPPSVPAGSYNGTVDFALWGN